MRVNDDLGLTSPWAEAAVMLGAVLVGLLAALALNLWLDVAAGEAVLSGTVIFFLQLTAYLSWRLGHTVNALIVRLTHIEDDVAQLRTPGGVADMIADAAAAHSTLADRLQAVEEAIAPLVDRQRPISAQAANSSGPRSNRAVPAPQAAPVSIQERNAARRQGHQPQPITVVDELNEHYEEKSPLPRMLAGTREDRRQQDGRVQDSRGIGANQTSSQGARAQDPRAQGGQAQATQTKGLQAKGMRAATSGPAMDDDVDSMMRELAEEIIQPRARQELPQAGTPGRSGSGTQVQTDDERNAAEPAGRNRLNELADEQGRSLRTASDALRRLSRDGAAKSTASVHVQGASSGTRDRTAGSNFGAEGLASDASQTERIQELVRNAVASGGVDIHLQPIVSLRDQQVQHFDVCPRLTRTGGIPILPEIYKPIAKAIGLQNELESATLANSIEVLSQLASKGRATGLFCELRLEAIKDPVLMRDFIERMKRQKHLTKFLIFKLEESELARLSGTDIEGLDSLARLGFRFALQVRGPVALDAERLRLIKISFIRIGAATAGRMPKDQFSSLQDVLKQFQIELVVEGIDNEAALGPVHHATSLLVQGALIGEPRPARAEVDPAAGGIVAA